MTKEVKPQSNRGKYVILVGLNETLHLKHEFKHKLTTFTHLKTLFLDQLTDKDDGVKIKLVVGRDVSERRATCGPQVTRLTHLSWNHVDRGVEVQQLNRCGMRDEIDK